MTVSMSTASRGFAGELPLLRFNLARYCLAKAARNTPDKTALVICTDKDQPEMNQSWTFGQIEQMVLNMAGGLARSGLQRGDRLFIRMGNSIDYALVFFAANAAGLVPVPASSQLTTREVSLLLGDSGAAAIACDGSLALPDLPENLIILDSQAIQALKQASPAAYCDTGKDEAAFLIYTSGTTSRPKGVLHAQRAVWGRRPMYRDWYDMTARDRLLHTGAFNWTYTLGTGLFDPWANGATSIVYTGEKDIHIWPQLIAAHEPTIMAAVPSLYRQMLKYCDLEPAGMASLRHCLAAGEPLPRAICEKWQHHTGLKLYEALGMSEISTYISSSPARPVKPGSPGKPQTGRCVAILPEAGGTEPLPINQTGVIAVHNSDPGLMAGYWQRPEDDRQARRGDWFVTGDRAQMDADGFIWFDGRNDDLMNAMGYRVSPVEVEAVLCSHRDVDQAAVCALEVAANTQIIVGLIVAHDSERVDLDAIMDFMQERLAAYKVPKKLLVVAALPCNASGKLVRKELAAIAQQSGG